MSTAPALPKAWWPVTQYFRTTIERNHTGVHIVDHLLLDPSIVAMRRLASITRKMHVRHINAYAASVLLAMLFVLVSGAGVFSLAKA